VREGVLAAKGQPAYSVGRTGSDCLDDSVAVRNIEPGYVTAPLLDVELFSEPLIGFAALHLAFLPQRIEGCMSCTAGGLGSLVSESAERVIRAFMYADTGAARLVGAEVDERPVAECLSTVYLSVRGVLDCALAVRTSLGLW
jgi:hypothetical protein